MGDSRNRLRQRHIMAGGATHTSQAFTGDSGVLAPPPSTMIRWCPWGPDPDEGELAAIGLHRHIGDFPDRHTRRPTRQHEKTYEAISLRRYYPVQVMEVAFRPLSPSAELRCRISPPQEVMRLSSLARPVGRFHSLPGVSAALGTNVLIRLAERLRTRGDRIHLGHPGQPPLTVKRNVAAAERERIDP
jgi:hypothetical protein